MVTGREPAWSRRLLMILVLILFVGAFVPLRFTSWLGALGGPVERVLAPASHAGYALSTWLAGGARANHEDPSTDQITRYEALTRQLSAENRRLRELIRDLQSGIEFSRRPVVPVVASVIARSSDPASPALTVRAGKRHGVQVNDVAAVRGVQIVGRVERAGERTCLVRPILDESIGPIEAEVFAKRGEGVPPGAEITSRGLRCQLEPAGGGGGGVLRGPLMAVFEGDDLSPLLPEAGDVVRLSDASWPESAQMLVLGRVEDIGKDEQQPLRYIVTVRPEVDLTRVAEVILRTSPSGDRDVREEGGP